MIIHDEVLTNAAHAVETSVNTCQIRSRMYPVTKISVYNKLATFHWQSYPMNILTLYTAVLAVNTSDNVW